MMATVLFHFKEQGDFRGPDVTFSVIKDENCKIWLKERLSYGNYSTEQVDFVILQVFTGWIESSNEWADVCDALRVESNMIISLH